jgi:hypothetical protein
VSSKGSVSSKGICVHVTGSAAASRTLIQIRPDDPAKSSNRGFNTSQGTGDPRPGGSLKARPAPRRQSTPAVHKNSIPAGSDKNACPELSQNRRVVT